MLNKPIVKNKILEKVKNKVIVDNLESLKYSLGSKYSVEKTYNGIRISRRNK